METKTAELRPAIEKLVENVARGEGIHNYVITDVQTNQKGEGYLGEIFKVTIKETNSDKTLDLIIKAAFTDEKVREMANIRSSFQNEIYFYSRVYPMFQKLDKDNNIQRVEMVPRCFLAREDDKEEMLALENLKSLGFETFDKQSVLGDDHIKMIFKLYGRFHGYSFVLRDQRPEEYKGLVNGVNNVWKEFFKKGFFGDHLVDMGKQAEKCLIPGEDDEIIKKYENYSGRNLADIFEKILSETVDYSTILHGDCWSNNMLFKYKDAANGRKPVDMRLIDFQIIMVGSPVCDLSYCLYSGASKKVFDNLNEYLEIYHDSFSSLVRELGSDPEKLYPFSALKEHWKRYSKFGMILAFMIIRMKLTHKEDLIDFCEGLEVEELMLKVKDTKVYEEDYSKRIRGLLWHMSEIGAL